MDSLCAAQSLTASLSALLRGDCSIEDADSRCMPSWLPQDSYRLRRRRSCCPLLSQSCPSPTTRIVSTASDGGLKCLTVIPPVQPEIGIGNAMLPLNTLLDIVTGPVSGGFVLVALQGTQTQDPTAMPTPNNRCPCMVLFETSVLAKLPLYVLRLSTKLIAPKPAFVVEPIILLDRTLLPMPLNSTIPPSVLPVTYFS